MARRNNNQTVSKKPRKPNRRDSEMMGVVTEIFGGGRMGVKGDDGKSYMGIIRGKLKKRMWVRIGDVVLIVPWEFETDKEDKLAKAHIVWRYTRTQTSWMLDRGYIKEEFINEMQNI